MIKSARELARAISDGKIEPMFIGTKNYYVIRQELLSILNEKHAIKTADERRAFEARIAGYSVAVESVRTERKRTMLTSLLNLILSNAPESESRKRLTGGKN